jgi:HEAT repeat protein
MRCINFDREFERYVGAWMKEHAKEYRNYDEMEAAMPDVYADFLDTPVNWLSGAKPGEYFAQFDNALHLVNWMEDYFKQRIPVPDMLLNRITELGEASEEALLHFLRKENATREMRMAAVTLLREIGSAGALEEYVQWQCDRQEGEDELADNALESLAALGDKAVPAMRDRLSAASPDGQEAMLTLLCHYPGDENVFETAMRLFDARPDRAAVLADCLGKLGDERAIEPLKALAASEETPYLDYIELRSAIEALGGECPERDFDAEDPAYEAMRSMQ